MKYIVKIVEFFTDRVFKCQTWRVEGAFVFIVLILLRYISGGFNLEYVLAFFHNTDPITFQSFWQNKALLLWLADWIMVFAVLFTFEHMGVARRMEEKQAEKELAGDAVEVACYKKLTRSFYYKEILFFISFCLLQSWSAVLGGVLFLCYPYWRKAWRKYHRHS